ncbi:translocation/assembly module TamB domain-containing protein [Roseovarius sp. SK2]|uniref:translocation/assembly module TamB domain-containing protein n=1 Tax=Roseovarius TaxID=74030 RepID=UPI00237B4CF7|nr:translocation/assembly module TamB domain-containing protein [Roseovarius sp. SK2]MDD9724861.1 translocation/assembly module TamB domain-containing protein [Roseovarius sp. SK2]
MRLLLSFLLILTFAISTPLLAQDQEEQDKSFIENWLQDNLSGAGRDVNVTGFRGALSSNATLEQLTIADENGVWLTLRDASLVWSRSALLRGRLEVDELTAAEVILERLPAGGETVSTDDAEATQFSLPELPVSVNVELVQIESVELGESVLGEPARLSLEGSVNLADGQGAANLAIQRLDRQDSLTFEGSFANETRVLALDLDFEEGPEGIVSTLLGIPDTPALRLQVTGDAPLSDFSARILLSSDGQERFGGTVNVGAIDGDDAQGYTFAADLDGDLRPLFEEQFQPFFGEATSLAVSGQTEATGRLVLDELALASEALELQGNLALSASGWPETLQLEGRIGSDEGDVVRLPISGAPTTLQNARLTASFDAAQDDAWQAEMQIVDLVQDNGVQLDRATLAGTGQITDAPDRSFSGDITFNAEGVDHSDPALAEAIGAAPAGSMTLDWQQDQPLVIDALDVESGNVTLTANGELESLEDGFPFTGSATLNAADLSRFAAISNQDISGAANATLEGTGTLLGGSFDIELEAETNDLAIGQPRLDPLMTGQGTLSLAARRDTTGTVLERLTIQTQALAANASGRLDADDGQLGIEARLQNVAQVEPTLSGPATLTTSVNWSTGDALNISALEATLAEATLTGSGAVFPEDPNLPAEGKVTLAAQDLSRFAQLAGRDLDGAATVVLEGSGRIRGGAFDIVLDAETNDVEIGEPRVDALMNGAGTVSIAAQRDTDGTVLERFSVRTPALEADASGRLDSDDGELTLKAAIADLARIEPRMSGPATLDTAATWEKGGAVTISRLEASGAGTTLSATGAAFPEDALLPVEGQMTLNASDLSRLAPLLNRPLTGTLDMTLEGSGQVRGRTLDITTDIDGSNLRTGIAQVDQLIAGSIDARASVALGESAPGIRYIEIQTPRVTVDAQGSGPGAPVNLSARLADLGIFVPAFPGAVSANGTITIVDRAGERIRLSLDATGPGGINARVNGSINSYGSSLDLDVNGSAPLALANPFLAPRSIVGLANFDLSVNGPPALNSLSGVVNVSDGRFALPSLSTAITGITGAVRLASGRAETNITASMGTGGNFRVRGPITLSAPFNANLEAALNDLVVTDPDLYTTTLSGQVGINGPLTGGATIGGTVNLGRTELRVPSGSGTRTPGDIPEITHVGEPADVRRTRARAGIIGQDSGGNPVAFPLDLVINAPNRIFVRGRGLDAELGGRVRLQGTTADVVPSGLFELIRGRLDILGRRLELTEGVIDLRGALDPYLRFVAETENDGILVRTIIEGLASSPSVSFESVPDLPQDEAVARLLFGRGLEDISAFQAAQLVAAAATLSGQRSGGLDIRGALGLSDLDVSTSEDGATQVTAGAYLSENLYSEVTADSEGNQEINLNLDIGRNLTVKGSTSTTGNTGVGIFFEKDY